MDNGMGMVFVVFCVAPLIIFGFGFAFGRVSKTFTITRRDSNNAIRSGRFAPTSTRRPSKANQRPGAPGQHADAMAVDDPAVSGR